MKKAFNETAKERIEEIAHAAVRIDLDALAVDDEQRRLCENVRAYLIDTKQKNELILLREGINATEENERAFGRYAKILNPSHPAYKYKFVVRKRTKEIFDRDKIYQRMRGEIARWGNRERKALREKIASFDPPLSQDEAEYMNERLEKHIEAEMERVEQVLSDFDAYDVVITNHEFAGNYPALYLTLRTDDKKGYIKHGTEHLRVGVPNFVWYEPDTSRPALNRADMKIDTIVQTFDRIGDTIYIQPKKEE